jgi:hypothetical protein
MNRSHGRNEIGRGTRRGNMTVGAQTRHPYKSPRGRDSRYAGFDAYHGAEPGLACGAPSPVYEAGFFSPFPPPARISIVELIFVPLELGALALSVPFFRQGRAHVPSAG